MITTRLLLLALVMASSIAEAAQPPPPPLQPPSPQPPTPVFIAPPQADPSLTTKVVLVTNTVQVTNAVIVTNAVQVTNELVVTNRLPAYNYEQRLYAGGSVLVTPEQAKAVIDRFRASYPKLSSPRFVLSVSRATANAEPYLTDSAALQDVERLIGRSFRVSGATLIDTSAAMQAVGNKPLKIAKTPTDNGLSEAERKELARLADVVIEIRLSSRNLAVRDVSGDKTYAVSEIQTSAIRLADASVLGHAAASDLIGAGPLVRYFDVREIGEATGLALMEDMTLHLQAVEPK